MVTPPDSASLPCCHAGTLISMAPWMLENRIRTPNSVLLADGYCTLWYGLALLILAASKVQHLKQRLSTINFHTSVRRWTQWLLILILTFRFSCILLISQWQSQTFHQCRDYMCFNSEPESAPWTFYFGFHGVGPEKPSENCWCLHFTSTSN